MNLFLQSLTLLAAFLFTSEIHGLRGEQGSENAYPELTLASSSARPVEEIDAYVKSLAAKDRFSGVVLIASKGEIWFEEAYGLASREFGVPNNIDTRFDVGSFNKDYTRLAIMQLVQNQVLSVQDSVGEHLPDYPNERVKEEVTIQQLLDHRSGLADYFDEDYFNTPMSQLRDIASYIPIWGPKPLVYEPGTRESYSNYGYTVLGAIVEEITAMSYPDYVQEFIFEPAGMQTSGFFHTDGIEPNVAVGYTTMDDLGRPGGELRKNIYLEPARGGPWGKSYSSARDLYRFFDALHADELIDAQFNWASNGWERPTMLAGGGPGLSAMLFVDSGSAVIVLSNQDMPAAEHMAERLAAALR